MCVRQETELTRGTPVPGPDSTETGKGQVVTRTLGTRDWSPGSGTTRVNNLTGSTVFERTPEEGVSTVLLHPTHDLTLCTEEHRLKEKG